ncbi:hypothetical protein MRX96_018055 [Rhipicephalus microplus]
MRPARATGQHCPPNLESYIDLTEKIRLSSAVHVVYTGICNISAGLGSRFAVEALRLRGDSTATSSGKTTKAGFPVSAPLSLATAHLVFATHIFVHLRKATGQRCRPKPASDTDPTERIRLPSAIYAVYTGYLQYLGRAWIKIRC